MGNKYIFCVGFSHTLSGAEIFLYLFVSGSVCHMVSIRKREDPGNECLCKGGHLILFSAVAIW